jgi:hypothetical protein
MEENHVFSILKKKWLLWFFLLLPVLSPANPVSAEAGSGSIQFSTSSAQIKRGDLFTVVCQVSSEEAFVDVSFTIDYEDSVMEFIKGGSKVSGGYGELTVDSSGNSDETYKKTFSLQFMAQGKGAGMISVKKGTVEMTDADGNAFSTSSNALSIQVSKKGAASAAENSANPEPAQKNGSQNPESAPGSQKQEGSVPSQNPQGAPDSQKQEGNVPSQNPEKDDRAETGAAAAAAPKQGDIMAAAPEETAAATVTATPENENAKTDNRDAGETLSYVLVGIIVVVAIVFIGIFSVWRTTNRR